MEKASRERQQTRKRKARASNTPENSGDEGKKRGRPRVVKQDESAADRRRTQIRMAQRAYRQRKESTLDELRKRVSELNNTLELMNKAFVHCRDSMMAPGIPAKSMEVLRETSLQYEDLMSRVRNPGEECDLEITQTVPRASSGSVSGSEAKKQPEATNVLSWMDEAALQSVREKRESDVDLAMGYTMYSNGTATTDPDVAMEFLTDADQSLVRTLPKLSPPTPKSFESVVAELTDGFDFPASITLPATYSFQETTFARRLHRACLENSYQLLLDPQRRPASFKRAFELSLLIQTKARLTTAIGEILKRGPHEALYFSHPLVHVGGAGTHYPRRDPFGNLQPKRESWDLGTVGPGTLSILENAARENVTADMTVNVMGFEGQWLDPYDVEGYLNERGIFIDPSTSFAEAEVHVWSDAARSESNSDGPSPQTPSDHPFTAGQLEFLSRHDAMPEDFNNFMYMDMTDIGYSDSSGSWMNFIQPGQSTKNHGIVEADQAATTMENVDTWEGSRSSEYLQGSVKSRLSMFEKPENGRAPPLGKKVIIIDVAKFVKVLTASGICIGRSPGFKKRDIDRALAVSSFDAA